MNIQPIRRIIILSALVAGALAGTVAQADPLPAPKVRGDIVAPLPPITLVTPGEGVNVSYTDTFVWSDGGANSYLLKMKVLETGEKFKQTVGGDACGGDDCEVPAMLTALFNTATDGQSVKWKVVGKYGPDKIKSDQRTLIVNTVDAPTAMAPSDGAKLEIDDLLYWNNSPANQTYTLVVKHVASNTKVIKEMFLNGDCAIVCSVDPRTLAQFQGGATYQWFVKAKGFNGDKAKSAKRTFTTPLVIVGS